MKLARLIVFVALLTFGASLSPEVRGQSSAASRMTPDALVKDLYWQHDHKHSPFFQTRTRALLYKYFEKSLADMIWRDAANSKKEVGAIDGDPLYDAQDMDIKKFAIGKPSYGNGKSLVSVSFENFGQQKTIVFILVNGRSGWRIGDLDYGQGRTLKGDLKGTSSP